MFVKKIERMKQSINQLLEDYTHKLNGTSEFIFHPAEDIVNELDNFFTLDEESRIFYDEEKSEEEENLKEKENESNIEENWTKDF